MMDTPICDFVRSYAQSKQLRLHMPGHKGKGPLGPEMLDITEIDGADSLYEAAGIIRRSEENAARLFDCPTFYSTEGSSHCIRAMLYLCLLYGKMLGRRPVIAAGRNAHKAFLSGAALLDLKVNWLYPKTPDSYLSCLLQEEDLEAALSQMEEKPVAVYLTSPDYLGNVADIAALARVCHRHGVLLLVDNAHGAYLRFLQPSGHPMDLGADLCCDSAHKTLPVLTGGAYLHIAKEAPGMFAEKAKSALALFGSTSPSYLILQSLDAANQYLSENYSCKLASIAQRIQALKEKLAAWGYDLQGQEPLKITVATKSYGYTGTELAWLLQEKGIICEFSDPDYVVMMLTPETEELTLLEKAFREIPRKPAIFQKPPAFSWPEQVLSPREAMFSPSRRVRILESEGKILADAAVGCPPAVPVVICGERMDANAIRCFAYYGVEECSVVEEV